MGEIVAAIATCHAPQLFTYPPDEDHAQLDSTIVAMRELGKVLDQTKPDVVIFLGSDHLETFSIGCVPLFAILAGNRAVARFANRTYDLPIHREMAEDFLTRLVRAEFDFAYSEDAVLGHSFAVPFEFVLGGRDIPIVPFHTNVYLPPLASPKRCAGLGREIAGIIASRSERVAIIASGGMSHFPGTWKYLHPDFAFDRWMIGELERGNADALLDLTVEQLDEVGNTELLTWAILLGAIGEQPGELLHYTPTWHHGHAMMRFLPAREKTAAAGADKQSYVRYEFKNTDFEFYKHPPAAAYKLNKLLFDVRHDSELRLRLLNDLDGVAREWGLNDAEKEATQAIASVGGNAKISDSAAALVKAGAHPLQALMSLHAVHGEFTRLQQEAAKRK